MRSIYRFSSTPHAHSCVFVRLTKNDRAHAQSRFNGKTPKQKCQKLRSWIRELHCSTYHFFVEEITVIILSFRKKLFVRNIEHCSLLITVKTPPLCRLKFDSTLTFVNIEQSCLRSGNFSPQWFFFILPYNYVTESFESSLGRNFWGEREAACFNSRTRISDSARTLYFV